MSFYNAGTLDVQLLGYSDKAIISIRNTTKALSSLYNVINKINNTQFVLAGKKIQHIFEKIAQATKSIDSRALSTLANASKSLSALSRVGNLEKTDFNKIGAGFNQLTISITPFIELIKSAEPSLVAFNSVLKSANSKKLQNASGGGTKSKKGGFFSFLNISKWLGVLYMGRRFGRALGSIVQAGADYTETLNLWETAMGKNVNLATEFVAKMNKAYGISEKTLMNAQATFKNMLGSLRQISDDMAYRLSEGITQMAVDYASLYNVTFNKAFEKFQAALAGQVRPIRSVSGYDITENTLYQLYQQLGGTKSVRNLSRTEKQLLSIMAVFNQMTASGAVGDLDKTMTSFANQSRAMAENFNEVKTWIGTIITYTIEESGLMVKVNALLITAGRYLKAVATELGAIKSFGGDVFGDVEDNIIGANDAIDELQGKLLDFDKFRSLSGSQENALGLDEKLLNALAGYDTILSNASNEARELSDQWLKALGFTIDANGELQLTNEQLESIRKKIFSFVNSLSSFDGVLVLQGISTIVSIILTTLKELLPVITVLSQSASPIILGIIQVVGGLVQILDALGLLEIVIVAIISYKLATRIMKMSENITKLYKNALLPFINYLKKQMETTLPLTRAEITKLDLAFASLGLAVLAVGVSSFLSAWDNMSGVQKAVGIFTALAGALTAVSIAWHATHNWAKALSVGAMVAGGALFVTSQLPKFAEGGLPDKGSMFIAGEAGAEIVYNTPSGQSGVVNIKQIEQAMYGALVRYGRQGNSQQPIEVYLDGEKVYQNTTAHAKKRGNVWGRA